MVANRGLEKAEPGASWQSLFNTFPDVAIMKLSACDVTSGHVIWRLSASRKGGTGGGGWVHPKTENSMAVSRLSF